MTDGISTSPHCLYKSNIVDDVIINKTRQNELVKVFCEYKTEFLILFDDFFRSQDFPKPSPVLHHFFQYTHLRDAHFYRCKLIEHTVQFYFLNTKRQRDYVFRERKIQRAAKDSFNKGHKEFQQRPQRFPILFFYENSIVEILKDAEFVFRSD